MRRLALGSLVLLILASCAAKNGLPPEQVLERATRASQELASARFQISTSVTSGDPSLKNKPLGVSVKGILQDGGKQTEFLVTTEGQFLQSGQLFTLKAAADVFAAWDQDVYVRVREFSLKPPHPLINEEALRRFAGSWWQLPNEASSEKSPVTPDPRLLRMQSEIVAVTEDKGRETVNGRDSYHYGVSLDREKLLLFLKRVSEEQQEPFDEEASRVMVDSMEATGELWIDTESFVVHRLLWNIHRLPTQGSEELQIRIQADLTDHGTAPMITPPTEFTVFSPLQFLGTPALTPESETSDESQQSFPVEFIDGRRNALEEPPFDLKEYDTEEMPTETAPLPMP